MSNNDILGFGEDMDPANDNGRPVRRGKGKKRGGNINAIVKQRGGGNRPVVEPKPEDKPALSREESESILDELLGGENLISKEEDEVVDLDLEVIDGEVKIPQQPPQEMTPEDAEALNKYLIEPEPTDTEVMHNWLIHELPNQLLADEELKAMKKEIEELGLDPVQKHNLLNELNLKLLGAPAKVLVQVGKRSVIELQAEYYTLVVDINKEMVAKAKNLVAKQNPPTPPATVVEVTVNNPTITPVEVPKEVPAVNPILADAKAHEGARIAAHESDSKKTIGGSLEIELTISKGKPVPSDRLIFEFLELREVDGVQYWSPKFHRPVKPEDTVDHMMLERIMCNGVGRNQVYLQPITQVIVPCAVEVLPEGHLWIKKVEYQDGCSIIHLDPAA